MLSTLLLLTSLFRLGSLPATTVAFTDITPKTGINFKHVSGSKEKNYILETVSGGVALFDYDNDGDLDLYLVNGGDFYLLEGAARRKEHWNRLYRNDGNGTFTDVTEQAGVMGAGWGMGCCVADYDNDGHLDLFVTSFGPNILYRNNGDGTFTDVTREAGLSEKRWRWSTGCAFGDYDKDGYVDLFVAGYIDFDPSTIPKPGENKYCQYRGIPVQCGPRGLKGAGDTLYHNNGDGTFTDVTEKAGVSDPPGYYGFGVLWLDFDDDGDLDIFVANDSTPNYLYRNDGNGTFTDIGLMSGVALNEDGREQACMGVDSGDYDNDGRLDIYVTNFSEDYNTLYHNDGNENFTDVTAKAGLAEPTWNYLGWGTAFIDYDNDGWKDIFVANGHVYPQVDQHNFPTRWAQRNQLFRNLGNGTFKEVLAGSDDDGLSVVKVSRGAAFGDIDNDGDIDIVVSNIDDTPTIIRNDVGNSRNWIKIKLVGTKSNRAAIGARVKVVSGNLSQMDEVKGGSSYLSQNDLRLHFGLGQSQQADLIKVRWPTGQVESFKDVKANQVVVIEEGKGIK